MWVIEARRADEQEWSHYCDVYFDVVQLSQEWKLHKFKSRLQDIQLFLSLFFSCRVIVGAPKADTSQYQAGVRQGGAVYRCDISDDNRCQIIHFDSNGKSRFIFLKNSNH